MSDLNEVKPYDEQDGLDSEEDEDDFDEEEDLDEEQDDDRPRKKAKFNPFLDIEADVDEAEDDESDQDGDDLDFIDKEDDVLPSAEEILARRPHIDLDRRRKEEEDISAEELSRRLDARHKRRAATRFRGDSSNLPQAALLPTVNGPKLFMVKCRPGKERELVFQLMRKYFDKAASGSPLNVLSVFCRDDLKGYVYVEATQPAHVNQALDKMLGVYLTKMTLVPINEMTQTLTIQKKDETASLIEGNWVRVKRGKYSGDLAQIIEIADTGDTIKIKLVPRLDYTVAETAMLDSADKKRRKSASARPPQKLFNIRELPKHLAKNVTKGQRGRWILGSDVYKDGYLEKDVKVAALITTGVSPTLDEITKFTGQESDSIDAATLRSLNEQNQATNGSSESVAIFQQGDHVEVTKGEFTHLHGVIISIDGNTATVQPRIEGLTESLRFPLSDLRKRFTPGDHVKVVNGKHKNETGLVVSIVDNVATLISDMSLKEIHCFVKDLSEVGDVSHSGTSNGPTSALANIGKYDLQDLVVFDNNQFGVIIKIEEGAFQVVDSTNQVRTVRLQQVRAKRDSKRTAATDSQGNPITVGDSVKTNNRTRQGLVLHINRSTIWIHSRDILENAGIYATSTNNISLVGLKAGRTMSPEFAVPASPANNNQRNGYNSFGRGGGRGRGGRDPLIGQTVKVVGGVYKGYLGIVKEVTDAMARVELHTNCKTVNVRRDQLQTKSGAPVSAAFEEPSMYNPLASGSRTPAYMAAGSRTPAWSSSSRTPNPYLGSQTPNPYASDGARTPAWDAGSRTPAYRAASDDAWSASSRTPAYRPAESSSWNAGDDSMTPYRPADTPGFGNDGAWAPTPGASYSAAPTPQTWGTPAIPPTPGAADGRTPAGIAATPGAFSTIATPGPVATPGATSSTMPTASTTDSGRLSNWAVETIEVKIVPSKSNNDSFENGAYDSSIGVITKVGSPTQVTVQLLDSGNEITLPTTYIDPVKPEKKNLVLILGGEHQGESGTLIGVDGTDGIVKLNNAGSDFKIMNMNVLGKVHIQK
ncbi:hypothetical protein BKA69DRAFT_1043725 [Paraphysoderma sedebokerense]|nr:hypothetical protein BKA69DRAFT_1043725 [Paraphysoderma sedebokerense]